MRLKQLMNYVMVKQELDEAETVNERCHGETRGKRWLTQLMNSVLR